jgi:hypothetical protein
MIGMDRMALHSQRCMRQMVLFNSEHTLEKLENSLEMDLERALRARGNTGGASSTPLDAAPPTAVRAQSDSRPGTAKPMVEAPSASLNNVVEWGLDGRDLAEVISMLERLLDVTTQVRGLPPRPTHAPWLGEADRRVWVTRGVMRGLRKEKKRLAPLVPGVLLLQQPS